MFTAAHAGTAAPPRAQLRCDAADGSRGRSLCARRCVAPPPRRLRQKKAPSCIPSGDAYRGAVSHELGVFLTQNAKPLSEAVVPPVPFVPGVRRVRHARTLNS